MVLLPGGYASLQLGLDILSVSTVLDPIYLGPLNELSIPYGIEMALRTLVIWSEYLVLSSWNGRIGYEALYPWAR